MKSRSTAHFLRQTRRHTPTGQFPRPGKRQGSSLQHLRRFQGLLRPHGPRRHQRPYRFRTERHAFRRRFHEMVHAPDRRRRRHACRNSAGLSRVARLHSHAAAAAEMFYNHVKVGTPVVRRAISLATPCRHAVRSRSAVVRKQFERGLRGQFLEGLRDRSETKDAWRSFHLSTCASDKDRADRFLSLPPPGPAIPVVARAKSAPDVSRAPSAIACVPPRSPRRVARSTSERNA